MGRKRVGQFSHLTYQRPVAKNLRERFTFLRFQWDIGAMLEWLEENQESVANIEVATKELEPILDYIMTNREYAKTVDLSKPLIFVNLAPNEKLLVDGHHRVLKAVMEGVETLKGLELTFEQQMKFITSKETFEYLKERAEERMEERGKKNHIGA